MGARTALINHLRALLLERGLVVAKGRAKLRNEVGDILQGVSAELSPRIRVLVVDLVEEWERLDVRIKAFDNEFVAIARADPVMRRLTTIPGIGPINATALVAAVGDARSFGKGRDLSAWLGLVPRQATTGGKPRLLGISKRGNPYLRKNLVHGARAVLPKLATRDADRPLAARPARASTQECRCGGAREQAGAHLLGGPCRPPWFCRGGRRNALKTERHRRARAGTVQDVCGW